MNVNVWQLTPSGNAENWKQRDQCAVNLHSEWAIRILMVGCGKTCQGCSRYEHDWVKQLFIVRSVERLSSFCLAPFALVPIMSPTSPMSIPAKRCQGCWPITSLPRFVYRPQSPVIIDMASDAKCDPYGSRRRSYVED